MDIPTFLLERNQSEFENQVEINLTESGVHPVTVGELLNEQDLSHFLQLRIGYGYTEGTPELREAIATWYPGASVRNVLATTGTSEANFLVAWSLLRSSDTFAFMVPNFMQLAGVARGLAPMSSTSSCDRSSDGDWTLMKSVPAQDQARAGFGGQSS